MRSSRSPTAAFPQAQSAHDNFWDFISLTPECMHMIMWVMSDRAIPRSFRFMEGFGVHTFRLVNAKDESTFVKFHWKPKLGLQSVVWNEAVKINGADPDFHRRDLWDAIQSGNFPEWELRLQLFDQEFADSFDFDVLDPTKLIPGGDPRADPGRPPRARPHARQFLRRDRAGRVHDAERPARHRLLQRSAAAGPQLLLSRHAAEAARRPELHAYPDQRAEMPVPSFPAGRPHGDAQSRRPRELPAEFLRRRARGNRRSAASARSPTPRKVQKLRLRAESFADHYSQARQFFISQTATEQTPHRDGADLRAEQGRDAGHPRADGLASAQHRRGPRRRRRRQARHGEAAEAGGRGGRAARRSASRRRRSASSRTVRTASKAARSACWSATAPMPRS